MRPVSVKCNSRDCLAREPALSGGQVKWVPHQEHETGQQDLSIREVTLGLSSFNRGECLVQ